MPDTNSVKSTNVLLGCNRRIALLSIAAASLLVITGCSFVFRDAPSHFRFLGLLLLIVGLPVGYVAVLFFAVPRLAITGDHLLVYVRSSLKSPYRVPLDYVEVFFIGQGAVRGQAPGQPHGYEGAVAANVVVRLAESATDWQHRDIHQLLGIWDEGYITLRGLWCENIDQDLLKRMNRRLLDLKRQRRKKD